MQLSDLLCTTGFIITTAIAIPLHLRDDTPLYKLVVLAPCVSNCIAESMDKLVFTQADPITGNKTSTTMQDFETSSDVYRPVATIDFEEVSALPHEIWVDHEESKLHAAVSRSGC